MTDWKAAVHDWQNQYELRTAEPLPPQVLEEAEAQLGGLPFDLQSFYQQFNGLVSGWFRMLPIENPLDVKRTWDGIKRANNPSTTKFLGGDAEVLTRFLIFAEIGAFQCAAYDRVNGTIWFEEQEALNETDLTMIEFVETCLREVKEL